MNLLRGGSGVLHNSARTQGVQGLDGLQEVGPAGHPQTEEETHHFLTHYARIHQKHKDLPVLLARQK